MPRQNFDEYDELVDDICNYQEANPWHCHEGSSNMDYDYRANGWVHVPDDPDVQDGPYCPSDVLDALEFCGRLAYQFAIGEPVSPEQAAEAAGRAVKCFAYYNYEQQEWFTEAVPFMKEREPRIIRADDRFNEPHVNAGSGDKREGEATT